MHRIIKGLMFIVVIFLFAGTMQAQDFSIFDRDVQVHGFASQGFIYTNDNNWLTMKTSSGSFQDTEYGLNMSMAVTSKLRIGAQVYARDIGSLGAYHPTLDWAMADYRWRRWLSIRGGKVKTTLGLFTATQDLDFIHTFALLPQSVYPTDLRDATISHRGGDVYGTISLKHRLGNISYTGYAGNRSDSIYSGYPILLGSYGIHLSSYGGLQYGGDIRWEGLIKGLLFGVSRLNEDITAKGYADPIGAFPPGAYEEHSKADWLNQFFGQYTRGALHVEAEYRRFVRDQIIFNGLAEVETDVRGWYISGGYRISKHFEIGSYYSHYVVGQPAGTPDSPANHNYDKVITGRFDLNRFWNIKLEGHFMAGYGNAPYPNGFYTTVNPNGFSPNTNALVLRTGFTF